MKTFYVGQEVVAKQDHEQGAFKKGDEFKITSIRLGCCGYFVTVGIMSKHNYSHYASCTTCGIRHPNPIGSEWLFFASRFAPKIEISEFISMKKLAEKQLETIGAN